MIYGMKKKRIISRKSTEGHTLSELDIKTNVKKFTETTSNIVLLWTEILREKIKPRKYDCSM